MKKIYLLIVLLGMGKAYGQRLLGNSNNRVNNYNNNRVVDDNNRDQIHIVDSTQEIQVDILPYKNEPKIKNDRYYYWYLRNIIHSTQGGYSGQLLNGHYTAFYPDKNLKEEGDFKTGLKDGVWKTWNRKGDLTNVANWDEGIQVPDGQQPFWKKVPFLKKKDDQPQSTRPSGNE
jgi:antitoxin component YwqK of YwqJK toxin-antitoxin module